MIRLRRSARVVFVALAAGGLVAAMGSGPGTSLVVKAGQPDVYQATAASAAADTRHYQTGSPVDPAPAVNTATPLASLTADNAPKTEAHAAYAEPPATAQAATGLDNVPIPYPTQAEALCANCTSPVIRDADGNSDQSLNGSRIQTGGGVAHAAAAQLQASAHASNGRQTVGSTDQLANLYDAAIADIYGQINKPAPSPAPPTLPAGLNQPPPCSSVPVPASPTPSTQQVCPATLPLLGVVAQSGASDALTSIITSAQGTVLDTTANIAGTQLLDGLITIGSIRTEVRATGDGNAANSKITATNDIQEVCVAGDCHYSITADGICQQTESLQSCANDPINQQLRSQGFNVCRLGTAVSGQGTSLVTGTASGVLIEFHALSDSKNNITPDPAYYKDYNGDCSSGAPVPRPDFAGGISSYTVLGESSAQLFTRLFPVCTVCSAVSGDTGISGNGDTSLVISSVPGSGTTTITTVPGGGPGANRTSGSPALPGNAIATIRLQPSRDRRPLLLAAFGAFELVLLVNLTSLARARRRRVL